MFRHLFGVLMNEAGDGGTGGGGDSTAVTTVDNSAVATLDGGDGSGSGDGAGTGDGTVVALADANSQPIFDRSGRITQATSKAFRELETSNPTLRSILGQAQRALGTLGKLRSVLGPKPFDRIKELRDFEKEVGGRDGLAALRASVEDMDTSDSLYAKADPALLEMMTESPAGKHAFVRIWPHAVAKFSQLSPNGYTRWLGAQILNAIQKLEVVIGKDSNGKDVTEPFDLPYRLRRMYGMLPAPDAQGKAAGGSITPEQHLALISELSLIYNWTDRMRGWSNATPEDLTPQKEDTSAEAIRTAKAEADQALQESWRVKRDSVCNELLADEVAKQSKGLNLSSTDIANVKAKARASVNAIRRAQPDNNAKIQGFFDARNFDGYLKYNRRILEDNMKSEVEKALSIYGKKSTRRTAATTDTTRSQAQTQTQNTQQQNNQQQGQIVRLTLEQMKQLGGAHITKYMKQPIGNKPGTTMEDIKKKQYVLRAPNPWKLADGTRVQLP